MTICDVCAKEMTAGESCSMEEITLDGRSFARIRMSAEVLPMRATGERCGDCGVASGGFHHPGCAREQCPKCAQQLFCCACEKDDDDDG